MKHTHWLLAFVFLIVPLWGCGDGSCGEPYNSQSTTPCETSSDCRNVDCNDVCVEADSRGPASCNTSSSYCSCSCQYCFNYNL